MKTQSRSWLAIAARVLATQWPIYPWLPSTATPPERPLNGPRRSGHRNPAARVRRDPKRQRSIR